MYKTQVQQPPQQVRYQFIRPKGISSDYLQWRVNPMGGQIEIYPEEILRYQLALNNGYMDPQTSYFQIQVQTDIPMGSLQLDTSAFSFISQSLITSNSSEVERIPQYDQVGSILVQLGYNPIYATGKDYMGLGRSFLQTQQKATSSVPSSAGTTIGISTPTGGSTQYTAFADYSSSLFNPCFVYNQQPTIGMQNTGSLTSNSNDMTKQKTSWEKNFGSSNLGIVDPSAQTALNFGEIIGNSTSIVSQINGALYDSTLATNAANYKNGILIPRVQYSMANLDNRFIDVNSSLVRSCFVGTQPILPFQPTKPSLPYQISNPQNLNMRYYSNLNTNTPTHTNVTLPNQCGLHGYLNPYSPQLSIGADQPFISPTISSMWYEKWENIEIVGSCKQNALYSTFLSCIMGVLSPQKQLIPLRALYNILIQLTLSKFAMFSSGYMDRTPYDSAGMKYPIQRNYKFTRFDYILQIYQFQDNIMKRYLEQQLIKGVSFSTQTVQLTSIYMLGNQLQLRGSWQINAPSSYISEVYIRFLDAAYQRYPFLRKQYALSMGVTSFQIKYDTKWYPPQPITGNAGNPYFVDTSGNVQPFLFQLFRGKNLTFARQPGGITNGLNFSVNSRCYDYNNTKPLLPQPNNTQFSGNVNQMNVKSINDINMDTALGISSFHENRCIGRALYNYCFESVGHGREYVDGIWMGNSRPFEAIFNTSVQDPFMTEVGMYIFTRVHYIVTMGMGGISLERRPELLIEQ